MAIKIKINNYDVTEYDFGSKALWETPLEEAVFELYNDGTSSVAITEISIPVGFRVKLDAEPDNVLPAGESTYLTIIADTGMAGLFVGDLEVVNTSGTPKAACKLISLVSQTGTDVVYTTRARMESAFGRETILAWADKTGRRRVVDTQRTIDYYIYMRSRRMDAELSGGKVTVPFSYPIPETIVGLCTSMAAMDMYSARGIFNEEIDKKMHNLKKTYDQTMNHIRQGHMFVGNETAPIPFSFEET